MDAQQEQANEKSDRTWRRWEAFCQNQLPSSNSLLDGVPSRERIYFVRTFLGVLRDGNFHLDGTFLRFNPKGMAGSTVRVAASHLSSSFRMRGRCCPMHSETDQKVRLEEFSKLFRAFDRISKPVKQQKALTPKFLRALGVSGNELIVNSTRDHAIDLIIGGYFFACRICEIVKTPTEGRTKTCRLRCIIF